LDREAKRLPGVVMFAHMKIVGLSVGLLVTLSGLSMVSSAVPQRESSEPARGTTVHAVTVQLAQASAATGAILRSMVVRY
jgi:hypothetical protein